MFEYNFRGVTANLLINENKGNIIKIDILGNLIFVDNYSNKHVKQVAVLSASQHKVISKSVKSFIKLVLKIQKEIFI